ncbi:hypothetical protein ATANTOWER_011945 [Ataeniobius toweri]|uniref:Uncharacterized protein n=1 Tax=Ataeniobius toweri TaxID=208326 RepID=A0ABU7ASZ9_9TELE|nr:hypothetical protein [Ataeniobius toweri]
MWVDLLTDERGSTDRQKSFSSYVLKQPPMWLREGLTTESKHPDLAEKKQETGICFIQRSVLNQYRMKKPNSRDLCSFLEM